MKISYEKNKNKLHIDEHAPSVYSCYLKHVNITIRRITKISKVNRVQTIVLKKGNYF